MGIALSSLIEQIGISVQKANAVMEQTAVAAYLGQGFDKPSNDENETADFVPVCYTIDVPFTTGKKRITIPVTALMHHTSLKLEQVDVRLKFTVEKSSQNDLMISVESSDNPNTAITSELSLQFKNVPPSEGMARIDRHHIQSL